MPGAAGDDAGFADDELVAGAHADSEHVIHSERAGADADAAVIANGKYASGSVAGGEIHQVSVAVLLAGEERRAGGVADFDAGFKITGIDFTIAAGAVTAVVGAD